VWGCRMASRRRGEREGLFSDGDSLSVRDADAMLFGDMDPTVPITQLRRDGGTQPRAQLDPNTVQEYAEAMQAGDRFPPVTVFYDGTDYWLADGFHRVAAAERVGFEVIRAETKQGTQRDAVLYSVGVNAQHGLRRTNLDKRRAVEVLLADPEWSQWSDRDIAARAHVTHPFVGKLRGEMQAVTGNDYQLERTYTTKHGTTATMNTSAIRDANQRKDPTPGPSPQAGRGGVEQIPGYREIREAAATAAPVNQYGGDVITAAETKAVLDAMRYAMVQHDMDYAVAGAIEGYSGLPLAKVLAVCKLLVERGVIETAGSSSWRPVEYAKRAAAVQAAQVEPEQVGCMLVDLVNNLVDAAEELRQYAPDDEVINTWYMGDLRKAVQMLRAAQQVITDELAHWEGVYDEH